jgi:hypothetical protein
MKGSMQYCLCQQEIAVIFNLCHMTELILEVIKGIAIAFLYDLLKKLKKKLFE